MECSRTDAIASLQMGTYSLFLYTESVQVTSTNLFLSNHLQSLCNVNSLNQKLKKHESLKYLLDSLPHFIVLLMLFDQTEADNQLLILGTTRNANSICLSQVYDNWVDIVCANTFS